MAELGNINEVEMPEQKSDDELPKTSEATEGDKGKLEKTDSSDINTPSKDKSKKPEDKLDADDRKQVSPETEEKGKEIASHENPSDKLNPEMENNRDGLSDNEKEDLKKETGWSDNVVDSIGSKDEAQIYKDVGLQNENVNGKECLTRNDFDLDAKDEDGITNRDRMERGRPPVTDSGENVELHHIGQKQDSPLAELTTDEHRGAGNDAVLHDKTKESEIDRNEFAKERSAHWKDRLNEMERDKQ